MNKLTTFAIDGSDIKFIETVEVKPGVQCDVYAFANDGFRDLAIVTVKAGAKTPLQRVLKGLSTIEGFYGGAGTLTVSRDDGTERIYRFEQGDDPVKLAGITVQIGQVMQWAADKGEDLVFYEICDPPYEDGRFENLPE